MSAAFLSSSCSLLSFVVKVRAVPSAKAHPDRIWFRNHETLSGSILFHSAAKQCIAAFPADLPLERHPRSASVLPAGWLGVSPGGASGLGGGTPPQLAGETPTLRFWPRRWHRTGVPLFVRAIRAGRR